MTREDGNLFGPVRDKPLSFDAVMRELQEQKTKWVRSQVLVPAEQAQLDAWDPQPLPNLIHNDLWKAGLL